jgi:hypothetical protein
MGERKQLRHERVGGGFREIYTHVSRKDLGRIVSPLDRLARQGEAEDGEDSPAARE